MAIDPFEQMHEQYQEYREGIEATGQAPETEKTWFRQQMRGY